MGVDRLCGDVHDGRLGSGVDLRPPTVCLAHFGGGAQWTLSTYGLQMRVDDKVLGRVMAGDFAIITLVLSIGAGLLSSAAGVQWALTTFAGLAALAGTVYLVTTRGIRRGGEGISNIRADRERL